MGPGFGKNPQYFGVNADQGADPEHRAYFNIFIIFSGEKAHDDFDLELCFMTNK